jgi:hypothetical protein
MNSHITIPDDFLQSIERFETYRTKIWNLPKHESSFDVSADILADFVLEVPVAYQEFFLDYAARFTCGVLFAPGIVTPTKAPRPVRTVDPVVKHLIRTTPVKTVRTDIHMETIDLDVARMMSLVAV